MTYNCIKIISYKKVYLNSEKRKRKGEMCMLKKLKIKNRLLVGYGAVVALLLFVSAVALIGLSSLNGNMNQIMDKALAADTAVKMCRIDINIAAKDVREMALNPDPASYSGYETEINEKIQALKGRLADLKKSGAIDDDLYQKYETAVLNWKKIGERTVSTIQGGDREGATVILLNECAPALKEAVEITKEIDAITVQLQDKLLTKNEVSIQIIGIIIVVVLVLAIVFALWISGRIVKSITVPLEEIENVALEMSRGNLHADLTYDGNDEVGFVAKSLKNSQETLGAYIEDIGRAMKAFESGNFDVHPEQAFIGDFKAIEVSIDGFQNEMNHLVRNIQEASIQVEGGSVQVAESAQVLADGATEQAGVIQELSATIAEITEHIKHNANNADEINRDVSMVGEEIDISNEKMNKMVEAMNVISSTSKEISKIIATINEIASQTNLLALNASIEAARAGDAGRGFAVVADQVSLLATQSAEAAKTSNELIDASIRAVESGMEIATVTADGLKNVVEGAKAVTFKVVKIAEASKEQAVSIEQINQGVDQINNVVQNNSATAEESAATSEELTGQAEILKEQLAHFKIRAQ